MHTENRTQKIILTGLMTALVTVATMVIAVPVPFTSGYVHLGDSMIFLSVFILGWKYGAFAAGIGSALADLFLGYVHWAPWTLCIKGIMAIIMGLIIQKCLNSKRNTVIASLITAGVWVIFNFAVKQIVIYEAAHNAEALLEDAGVNSVSDLGLFLNGVQNKLMLVALIIPIILIIISVYIRKREHMLIPVYQILSMTMAGLWMVFGYYIAGGLIYGNFAVSAFSIPMNMIQFVCGFFIASIISAALCKTPARKFFAYRTITSLK
ncbi:ECF transporter S component [Anaerovorax odorimutans]|uniref:ECF transporter S component n=1 Tax=Anaerovorax odorimutans TaxID=109327 RepID=UPI00040487B6|nr:ECF transporter S component [Anaerovorax odorimutans]